MITLTRLLAKKLRAVCRRAMSLSTRGGGPSLTLETGAGGLTVRAQSGLAAVEYHESGVLDPELLTVPFRLLDDSEGTQETPITVEKSVKNRLLCQWHEKQVPVLLTYDQLPLPEQVFPARPATLLANEPHLLTALDDAMHSADSDGAGRYALQCVQLRGAGGQLVATDGHQLLFQSGFQFPWREDLLLPRTMCFGSKELAGCNLVHVGRSGDWVTFVAGRWTIHLPVLQEGRYPRCEDVLRNPAQAGTKLQITTGDARFAADYLRRMPRGESELEQPVTIDANGHIALRVQADQQPHPTELVLSSSQYTGTPVRINSDRRYLARALGMGLLEICLYGETGPLQCRDERRTLLWMPLSPNGAIAADEQTARVASPPEARSKLPTLQPRNLKAMPKKKRTVTTVEPVEAPALGSTNGQMPLENPLPAVAPTTSLAATSISATPVASGETAPVPEPAGSAIEQALALRETLRDALAQTSGLVSTLRREKKQSRLVASTLASLRQLHAVS